MLADVGMVKMYSKSAHVNDLGFAWTGPPLCMDRPSSLFLRFFRQVVLSYTVASDFFDVCFSRNLIYPTEEEWKCYILYIVYILFM